MKLRILFSVLVILLVVFALIYYSYVVPVDLGEKVESVTIEHGDSFSSIAQELVNKGVIQSERALKLAARISGVDKKLTPGLYRFTGKNSCRSVLTRLEKADFVRIKVTIPEGATIWQVASILQEKMSVDSSELIAFNQGTTLLQELQLPYLEGYLFPETYFFPWGSSTEFLLRDMVSMFHSVTDTIWPEKLPEGLTPQDVIILASIIEAETPLNNEHRMVSSVYHNRLRRKMKLDADPTVIYGLGGLDRPLWLKDLRKDTPYNTYMHRGFPPTPINSPGLASIKAALNPEETDYLFFVADNDGGHIFSRTNAEHNRAKERIKSQR